MTGSHWGFYIDHLKSFLDAHRIYEEPLTCNSRMRYSETLSNPTVANSEFHPGEVVTKADAAFIRQCSIRGIEYLVEQKQLKPIEWVHRPVVFKREQILSLPRRRKHRSGKRKARGDAPFKALLQDARRTLGGSGTV